MNRTFLHGVVAAGTAALMAGVPFGCSESDSKPGEQAIKKADAAAPGGEPCDACTSSAECTGTDVCVFFPDGKRACASSEGSTECCTGTNANRECQTYSAPAGTGGRSSTGGQEGSGGRPASGGAPVSGDASMSGGAGGTSGGPDAGDDAGDASDAGEASDAGGEKPPGAGAACESDEDCEAPWKCFTAHEDLMDLGGAAHGICSLDCTENHQTCYDVDPRTVCIHAGTATSHCLERCQIGPPFPGTQKCHGRADSACMELGDYTSCNPQCHNDADCDGRRCDLASGACVDSIVGSLPPGSACDPEADECRNGLCWELPTAPGAPGASCLGTCTLGTIGCGHDPASAAPLSFACLFAWAAGSVAGDLGLCAELCDCADACTHPNFTCTPLPEGARSKFGRDGYCRPALNPDGAAVPHLTCGD